MNFEGILIKMNAQTDRRQQIAIVGKLDIAFKLENQTFLVSKLSRLTFN